MASNLKKILKALGIIILVLVIIAAGLIVWQWKYVKALIDGLRYDEEALAQKQVQTAEKTISSVDEQISVPLREITEDEKARIASGELSQTALMAQILAEALAAPVPDAVSAEGTPAEEAASAQNEGTVSNQTAESGAPAVTAPADNTSAVSEQSGNSPTQSAAPSADSDQLIADAVSQLYQLQFQYTSQIDSLIGSAKEYYKQQKAANGSAAAKSSTLAKFSGEVASMENSCDAKVESLLSDLTSRLNSIGADTSIVSTLRSAYENEKSIQRASYVNKYMK